MFNIRVHKVRIAQRYSQTDPMVRIKSDKYGAGEFVDERKPSLYKDMLKKSLQIADVEPQPRFHLDGSDGSQTSNEEGDSANDRGLPLNDHSNAQNPETTIMFITQDTLRFAIKGFNLVLTSEYEIGGKNGWLGQLNKAGRIYLRIVNGLIFVDVKLVTNPKTGAPAVKVLGSPDIFFPDIRAKFDQTGNDVLLSFMSKLITDHLEDAIDLIVSKVIQQELPRLCDTVATVLGESTISSLDNFLEHIGFERPSWPRIAVANLRWKVKDERIVIGGYMRHIPIAERLAKTETMRAWQQAHIEAGAMDSESDSDTEADDNIALFVYNRRVRQAQQQELHPAHQSDGLDVSDSRSTASSRSSDSGINSDSE